MGSSNNNNINHNNNNTSPLVEEVPVLGHRFVSARVRRGLVPMVLEELLLARAQAKRELKQATALGGDPQLRAVLDGRQLALKISANSVYGFTGMSQGTMPCQAIAASVTAYGRQMIEKAKELVEAGICRDRGKERDARVIYGDRLCDAHPWQGLLTAARLRTWQGGS